MENSTTLIGKYAPDFELPGVDDTVHHLARYLETLRAVGVVFMSNQCPYVALYLERLKQIQHRFQAQGFTLIGINANDTVQSPNDSFEHMKQFAIAQDLNFPYLRDVTQEVAHGFQATQTPHVFLLDHHSVIQYSGSIDDQPQDPAAVQARYLESAITQLLQGEPISPNQTEVVGCPIQWRPH